MVSFEDFCAQDGVPLYQQILQYIKRRAASGLIRDREELPSRRVLSATLCVNPNTVQRAYCQLEEEGLIVSHPGAKSLMCLSVQRIEALQKELLVADARRTVAAWRQMGVSYEQAQQLLRQAWEEENT